jgi:flagellar protein FlaG
MQNKVASFAATPDPTFGRKSSAGPPEGGITAVRPVPSTDAADLRLIIEEDQASGAYIYKTVNRRTGEVVQQFPRQEILKLREETGYVAGGVIRTKA